jgi:putative transposase
MSNTYTQIYIQIVFCVKKREKLIDKSWREELFKYISGIIQNKGQKLYAIGGVEDHLHILVSMKPSISISELVRDIKMNSTYWINQKHFVKKRFEWQPGYGAFSYNQKLLDTVINYIFRQEVHHAKKDFKTEYKEMLNHYQVDFNEKYL